MPHRALHNYLFVPRRVRASVRYSRLSAEGSERFAKPGIFQPMRDFLVYDIFAWFIATWRVIKPFEYPNPITAKPYDIGENGDKTIRIAIAADWATDTEQADYIGKRIADLRADWTIHLGDTYYSGTEPEMQWSFGPGQRRDRDGHPTGTPDYGIWPRGARGSLTLAGNHEMYSSGVAYYNMIKNPDRGFGVKDPATGGFSGQPAPFFCLRTPHWLILGLDTGYDSLRTGILRFHPDNAKLEFPSALMNWMRDEVKTADETRGVIVLTHHQYLSAFHEETEFTEPARQLRSLFPQNDGILWIWGHEHRFSLYGRNQIDKDHIAAFGRCIGNGGMPDEHRHGRYVMNGQAKTRNLVAFDARTADCFPRRGILGPRSLGIGYNGYVLLDIAGAAAEITYYAGYRKETGEGPGRNDAVFRERWTCDNTTGHLHCTGAEDLTAGNKDGDRLTFFGKPDPARVGQ